MPAATRKHAIEPAALAIAMGMTITDAAASAGIGVRTLRRWLKHKTFQARINAIRSDTVRQATSRLTDGMRAAVDTLFNLQAADVPPAARLAAARSVLEFGSRLRLEQELLQRMEAAEEALATRGRT